TFTGARQTRPARQPPPALAHSRRSLCDPAPPAPRESAVRDPAARDAGAPGTSPRAAAGGEPAGRTTRWTDARPGVSTALRTCPACRAGIPAICPSRGEGGSAAGSGASAVAGPRVPFSPGVKRLRWVGRTVWVLRYHHSLLHSGPVALLLAVTACSSKGSGAPRAAVPVGGGVARGP